MAVQTTYATNITAAVAGMKADATPSTVVSKTVKTAAVGFGVAVKYGTNADECVAASAAADLVVGITLRDQAASLGTNDAIDVYAVNQSASILTQGCIWVTSGAAVVAGSPVYMIVGGSEAGKFTDDANDGASPANSYLLIPGAVFDSSAAAADTLVKVRMGNR